MENQYIEIKKAIASMEESITTIYENGSAIKVYIDETGERKIEHSLSPEDQDIVDRASEAVIYLKSKIK